MRDARTQARVTAALAAARAEHVATPSTELTHRAAALFTAAMAEAGYPDCYAYPDSEVTYEMEPDESVRMADPGGHGGDARRQRAWKRGWQLVRASLDKEAPSAAP